MGIRRFLLKLEATKVENVVRQHAEKQWSAKPGMQFIAMDGKVLRGSASLRAVRELSAEKDAWQDTTLGSSKYLNNLNEQDHQGVKLRIGPMLGFKDLKQTAVTIAGIELLLRVHQGQFALGLLRI